MPRLRGIFESMGAGVEHLVKIGEFCVWIVFLHARVMRGTYLRKLIGFLCQQPIFAVLSGPQ